IFRIERNGRCSKSPGQHQTFERDIDHSASLGIQAAERCKNQWRCKSDCRSNHSVVEDVTHGYLILGIKRPRPPRNNISIATSRMMIACSTCTKSFETLSVKISTKSPPRISPPNRIAASTTPTG